MPRAPRPRSWVGDALAAAAEACGAPFAIVTTPAGPLYGMRLRGRVIVITPTGCASVFGVSRGELQTFPECSAYVADLLDVRRLIARAALTL